MVDPKEPVPPVIVTIEFSKVMCSHPSSLGKCISLSNSEINGKPVNPACFQSFKFRCGKDPMLKKTQAMLMGYTLFGTA
jgi:hypothetical protein